MAIVFNTNDPRQTQSGSPPFLQLPEDVLKLVAREVGKFSPFIFEIDEDIVAGKNLASFKRISVLTYSVTKDSDLQNSIVKAGKLKMTQDRLSQSIFVSTGYYPA